MPQPHVSVLMPVRNGALYLGQAIESVVGCREPRLGLIIVDDGSTDATGEIIEGERRADLRIVALRQPANGIAVAIENARRQARAPLLARLDADGIAYPNRFQRQVERFWSDPDLLLLGSAVDKIDEGGRVVGSIRYPGEPSDLQQELWRRNVFVHSSVMVRDSAVRRAGGYRPYFLAAEDYDLWLRIAEHGRVANLRERLGAYRVHAASTTVLHAFRQALSAALARACARARRRNFPDPAIGLQEPMDIERENWPLAFDDEVRLYRALAFADPATFPQAPTDGGRRPAAACQRASASRAQIGAGGSCRDVAPSRGAEAVLAAWHRGRIPRNGSLARGAVAPAARQAELGCMRVIGRACASACRQWFKYQLDCLVVPRG